jgi:hypothetical protein
MMGALTSGPPLSPARWHAGIPLQLGGISRLGRLWPLGENGAPGLFFLFFVQTILFFCFETKDFVLQ